MVSSVVDSPRPVGKTCLPTKSGLDLLHAVYFRTTLFYIRAQLVRTPPSPEEWSPVDQPITNAAALEQIAKSLLDLQGIAEFAPHCPEAATMTSSLETRIENWDDQLLQGRNSLSQIWNHTFRKSATSPQRFNRLATSPIKPFEKDMRAFVDERFAALGATPEHSWISFMMAQVRVLIHCLHGFRLH